MNNELEYNFDDKIISVMDRKYKVVYTINRENSKIYITNYVDYNKLKRKKKFNVKKFYKKRLKNLRKT